MHPRGHVVSTTTTHTHHHHNHHGYSLTLTHPGGQIFAGMFGGQAVALKESYAMLMDEVGQRHHAMTSPSHHITTSQ